MNKLDNIRDSWERSKYYNNPTILGKVLKKIQEHNLEYYCDMKGEPLVKWGGKWTPYITVSKLDKKLFVENLYN